MKLWWFVIPATAVLVVACIAGAIEQWWRDKHRP